MVRSKSETYIDKIRGYKYNVHTVKLEGNKLAAEVRLLSTKVAKMEMRHQQMIAVLKMILDNYSKRTGHNKFTMEELVSYIDKEVRNYTLSANDEEIDLFQDLINNRTSQGDTIGIKPGEDKNDRI